ncbi:MAG: NfeD family protein [Planctomycetota bacterium]
MENWLVWSLVLFGLGLLLTAIEVLVPSGGLLAVLAVICLAGSLFCAYQISGRTAAILAGVEVVVVPIVVAVTFKVLPKTRLGKQLILSPPKSGEAGASAANSGGFGGSGDFESLIGTEGVAATALRPSGTAEFGTRRVSVVSDGEPVAQGARVRVVLIEGNRIVVEPVDQ